MKLIPKHKLTTARNNNIFGKKMQDKIKACKNLKILAGIANHW
jgi:hypothetical protein